MAGGLRTAWEAGEAQGVTVGSSRFPSERQCLAPNGWCPWVGAGLRGGRRSSQVLGWEPWGVPTDTEPERRGGGGRSHAGAAGRSRCLY